LREQTYVSLNKLLGNAKAGHDHGVGHLAYIPTKNGVTLNFMPKLEGGGVQ
jgi:hypothetical protein